MKRLAAVILLCILLFNLVGYRILSGYFQHKYDAQLEALLDLNQYDESQLTEFKIPLQVAYQTNWTRHYERVDGEITMNGVIYKYVKRKYFQDTLYLQCIPHLKAMQVASTNNDFLRSYNNLAPDKTSKSENLKFLSFIKLTSEYCEHQFYVDAQPVFISSSVFFSRSAESISTTARILPEQPPEAIPLNRVLA